MGASHSRREQDARTLIEPIWDLVEKINSREGVGEHSTVEGSQLLWGMEYLGGDRRHEMSGILGSGET